MNPFARLFERLSSAKSSAAAGAEVTLTAESLAPGTVLAGVSIAQAIGRGASAIVYSGQDIASHAPRAVKVWCPRTGIGDDPAAARERFLQEAQHSLRLEHPGIVRVFGGGSQAGLAFVIMELLAGSNLARHATAEHRLPEALVLDIAAQLGAALAHAHRQGVLHRDVKPSNALFDPATRRAALTDFGLARAPDAQASRSGMFLGSPVYMAPELLGGAAADARSDLYALGVTVYELLAGRPPFAASSMGSLLRAVARQPPPPMASVRPALAGALGSSLDELLSPLLTKDPAQRCADGDAWAERARQLARQLQTPAG